MLLTSIGPVLAQGPDWIRFDVGALADQFWANTVDGLAYGAIYALIAMGYTMVYGVLQLINFAHSEVFIVGAYALFFTLAALASARPPRPLTGRPGRRPDTRDAGRDGRRRDRGGPARTHRLPAAATSERPRLAFLITAIGASFALQYLIFAWRGPNPEPALIMFRPRSSSRSRCPGRQPADRHLRRRDRPDGRRGPVREPVPARTRPAGRRPGPGHRDADGGQPRARHRPDLPHRRHPTARRRCSTS